MPSYNNPNDVLDLAQRLYVKQPNLGNANIDSNNILKAIYNLAQQDMRQPGIDIQTIDNISKARALNKLMGDPDEPLPWENIKYNKLGIKMSQDFNIDGWNPESDAFDMYDPSLYTSVEDVINTPYIPESALYTNITSSNDSPPIHINTVRPHLNTALGKWYLSKGGVK